MMVLRLQNTYIKSILKTVFVRLTILSIVAIIVNVFLTGYFRGKKELREKENDLIQSEASKILEDIYFIPVELELIEIKERTTVIAGMPKLTYGKYVYRINSSVAQDHILIYWELNKEKPAIKKIESYSTNKILYQDS